MLKVAVIGAGFMGGLHARVLDEYPRSQLAGVIDVSVETGTSIANTFGTRYFSNVAAAIRSGEVDAFTLALPDRLHETASLEVLQSGRPLLLEKPMAHTLEVARTIATAAETHNARLLIGHVLRFDPRFATAADMVKSGRLGEPLHFSAGRVADRSVGVRMNGTSSVLFYLGVHDIDAIQWVTGHRVTHVFARSVSRLMPSLGVDSEDAIVVTLELENGAVGQLFNGWTRVAGGPVEIDGRLELFGTDGSLEIDVRDHGLNVHTNNGIETPDALHWPTVHGKIKGDLAAEIHHFVDAVLSDTPFIITPTEAMQNVAVTDAIFASLKSGERVRVETI